MATGWVTSRRWIEGRRDMNVALRGVVLRWPSGGGGRTGPSEKRRTGPSRRLPDRQPRLVEDRDLSGQADPYREGKNKDILCSGSAANRFVIR